MDAPGLTENEILGVSHYWRGMSYVSYMELALLCDSLQPFFSAMNNHSVIEIGPGINPITSHYDCMEYVAAEGHYPSDGVSVLRKEDDASVVVVSFGVIDDAVLMGTSNPNNAGGVLTARYINELVKEIRRVANPFCMIVGNDALKYMGEPDISTFDFDHGCGGVYISGNGMPCMNNGQSLM